MKIIIIIILTLALFVMCSESREITGDVEEIGKYCDGETGCVPVFALSNGVRGRAVHVLIPYCANQTTPARFKVRGVGGDTGFFIHRLECLP